MITLIGSLVMTMTSEIRACPAGHHPDGRRIGRNQRGRVQDRSPSRSAGRRRAAGWVGGLGAFGGFVIPPMMAFAVGDLGERGYSIGFVVFVYLTISALLMAWILKYAMEATSTARSTPSSLIEAEAAFPLETLRAQARMLAATLLTHAGIEDDILRPAIVAWLPSAAEDRAPNRPSAHCSPPRLHRGGRHRGGGGATLRRRLPDPRAFR
ncbi:MAG: hypothetical protein R2748_22035 [Bryobacterales bacterium]